MVLYALGVNHTTADLSFRERLVFGPHELGPALSRLAGMPGVDEVALLSTCNRTELYCSVEQSAVLDQVLGWVAEQKGVSTQELNDRHYRHADARAARHMMSVASGLDSLVLGEPQILGQMKSSYGLAVQAGTLGSALHAVFQRAFSVAKNVRSNTAIGENPVSIAYAAVSLAQQIFSSLKNDTVLLIGAGEMIELVARHLKQQGIKAMIVANRSLDNAQRLAEQFDAEPVLLGDMPDVLHRADIIISSTASQLPILGKGAVEAALRRRKHKPMFMVDIAVPRDIEPQVAKLNDVYLYTVDDLSQVIDSNKRSREKAANLALEIVDAGVKAFKRDQMAIGAVETIKKFRSNVQRLREEEVLRAQKALAAGIPPEEALANLSRALTNKFLHVPTVRIKEAGERGDTEMIDHFIQAFDLNELGSVDDE